VQLSDLRRRLREHGALPPHEARVLRRWIRGQPQAGGRPPDEGFLPARLRDALPGLMVEFDRLARLVSEHPAADGSARLLVETSSSAAEAPVLVESVLLPRAGVCVSSQVGCAVGCLFCMTGRDGLLRQLGSAQIAAQVALAQRLRPVRKVVFMGMGEPAHNIEAVMEAIEFLGGEGGIGHKNLVFSTVGDRRVFERLPRAAVKPALALSLHSTRDGLRRELLPRAPRIGVDELVEAGETYARATGYPIQYQWTLLDGVNDGAAELDGIVRLLAGRYAVLNLIPYNANEGLPFRRPPWERCTAIAGELSRRGVLTKLRRSAGQDVEGGCGQLRARSVAIAPANPLAPRHGAAAAT
jgi:23S rRNA (adenine2503-C2)-methyltransferase